jgi:CRISPR-associated protein Cmr4
MYKKATPLFMVCETALHAGSGSDLGIIDLPIQRERHTSFPKIESSSLKGSIREAFENALTENDDDRIKIQLAFGYDEAGVKQKVRDHFVNCNQFQGAIGFTDARLLLFPVKSMRGVFAWITCPKVLEQFRRDLSLNTVLVDDSTLKQILQKNVPEIKSDESLVSSSNLIVNAQEEDAARKKIVLEEYSFKAEEDTDYCTPLASALADCLFKKPEGVQDIYEFWRNHISKALVILHDDDFTDFVNLSTEVITRTKIDNTTGTVADGALFTEEYLPAESILYSLVFSGPVFLPADKKQLFTDPESPSNSEAETKLVTDFFIDNLPEVIQTGGNATLGKGLLRTIPVR